MQQYDWLKNTLLHDFCFNAIRCDHSVSTGPVNKNVSTGAFITAKPGTEPGVHKLLANYQTGLGYKLRRVNGWYGRIGLRSSRSVMNAPETKSMHSSVTIRQRRRSTQQKCLNGHDMMGTFLLRTHWYN